jgi:fatty-acyl-CoA synthase
MSRQADATSDLLPAEVLRLRATDSPDRPAYVTRNGHYTWGTLLDETRQTAAALSALGIGPGSICGVVLPSSLEFIRVFFGAQWLGAIPVALGPGLPPDLIAQRLRAVHCQVAVLPDDLRHQLSPVGARMVTPGELMQEPMPPSAAYQGGTAQDISHLQFTSGSTGVPKAAMIRHANIQASLEAMREWVAPGADDVYVGALPLHHDFGLIAFLFQPLYIGATCYLIEPSIVTLRTWLDTIGRVKGTLTGAPDTVFRIATRVLPRGGADLRSLRAAINGSETVRLSTITAFEDHFNVPELVRPAYGLAEATLAVTGVRLGDALNTDDTGAVSCGQSLSGVRVEIVDQDGLPVPAGHAGRIRVQGPVVFAGYLDDQAETDAVLKDGWLETGDQGALGSQGRLHVHGRSRAMIKRGGTAIAPREVEDIVDAVSGVGRSAAVGVVSGADAITEHLVIVAELDRHVRDDAHPRLRQHIATVVSEGVGIAPRRVLFVRPGTIPRTPTGKTQYVELQRQLYGQIDLSDQSEA